MSDILCITNRSLCREDFITRIKKIAAAQPLGIVLREKDLTESQYKELAVRVLAICNEHGTPCILHTFTSVALQLDCTAIHLPLHILRKLSKQGRSHFNILGASCHSVEEAIEAEKLGCTYITAGHIFDTDCKKGLPGRGLSFLENVCQNVSIPVYAIGGIRTENIAQVRERGAKGACIMSSVMTCDDINAYLGALK